MAKLYWMDSMIASNSGENISFAPGSLSGISSVTVSGAIREVATQKTGVKMSTNVAQDATSVSFVNSYFTNDMYVDYYCSKDIDLLGVPTYNDSTKTLTFSCNPVKEACTFKIVVKF